MEINPFTEKRPWGEFRQFTKNVNSTVKTLLIKEGQSFSLQYHHHRREFWKILLGKAEVTIDDSKIFADIGQEFLIPEGTKHRIKALEGDVYVLEISEGIFDEEDIVRTEDEYGRI
ncbi:hypothetical protein BH11PAT3_BH11PAT3_2020 [soil metagenome]